MKPLTKKDVMLEVDLFMQELDEKIASGNINRGYPPALNSQLEAIITKREKEWLSALQGLLKDLKTIHTDEWGFCHLTGEDAFDKIIEKWFPILEEVKE